MFGDIWASFWRMPAWVRVWVFLVLVPVNLISPAFLGQPLAGWVAMLAVGGVAPNALILLIDRGFSDRMALSHIVLWVPLIGLLIWLLQSDAEITKAYYAYLVVLLVVDAISLIFDIPGFLMWLRGDRNVI